MVVGAADVEFDAKTDVLVAVAGATGLVATLAACESEDLHVSLLEKSDEVGGNAALSTGMVQHLCEHSVDLVHWLIDY
jgi:fumarate reductase flavoprotein subunit